jgi:pilus assembly protein CpaE
MSIYFLSSQPYSSSVAAVKRKIGGVLPDLKTIENLEEIAQHISSPSAGRAVVIFVASALDPANIDNLISIASQHRERVFFVLISDEISATDYKRLVRTRGADWVSTNGTAQEVLDVIAVHELPGGPVVEGPGRPVVVTFIPSAGGVGNTTIAIEVGVSLKSQRARSRRICCVDLDFQNSHMCDYLDIEPRFQIQEIIDRPDRLDTHLFSIFVTRHSSGVDVIAAPRTKFDPCEIALGALDALFDMIAKSYDMVLVDLPVAWFSWTAPVIANSDAAVITGINTIPCLRQVAETLEAVRGAKRKEAAIAVVINRCKRRIIGGFAHRQHVEAVLGGQKLFYIGDDSAALESANTGRPMISSAASRKTKAEFSTLALFCAELKSLAPVQGSSRAL